MHQVKVVIPSGVKNINYKMALMRFKDPIHNSFRLQDQGLGSQYWITSEKKVILFEYANGRLENLVKGSLDFTCINHYAPENIHTKLIKYALKFMPLTFFVENGNMWMVL